jgi:2-hydroxy-3-oxopropionate reductase
MSATPAVGFIGLGIMGRPMAGHLLDAGYPLTVNTRTAATASDLLQAGATWAESAADVARASDVVLTMLPDTPDVRSVFIGPGGIVEGAHPDLLVVDMSTIDPTTTRELHERLKEHGVVSLDAPVSGGQKGANERTLSIMVGGPADAFERARPILAAMGRTIVRVGEAGAGQVAKACNQLVVGANIQAVAEALSLARRSGVDPAAVREVLLGGFAASRVLEVHGQRMLDRAFEPGFRIRLHRKDARIIRSLATSVGSPTPGFDVVAECLDRLDEAGAGELDHSALFTLVDEWAASDRGPVAQAARGET